MKFELFIASRYLRAKRRQAMIGVITTISIIGVAA
jgi:lipoprotein-releasing system permease protein